MGRDCHVFRSHCLNKVESGMIGADLGAGCGRWAQVLANRGALITAVDKIAAPEGCHHRIAWAQMRVEEWLEQLDPRARFDFIVTFNLIHFLDREYVLNELIPKLATRIHPGGWIAIRTFYQDPEPSPNEKGSFSLYTPQDLLGALPQWRTYRAYKDQDHSKGQCGTFRLWHITDVLATRPN